MFEQYFNPEQGLKENRIHQITHSYNVTQKLSRVSINIYSCKATTFGRNLPRNKFMQDLLQRLDVMSGEKLTEGMDNRGTKQSYYMYEVEKVKQLVINVRRMCVKRSISKSTTNNSLRSLYVDMVGLEPSTPNSQTSSSGDQLSPGQSVVGHIDTAEVSPIDLAIVLDDATADETATPAPEFAIALEDETEDESAPPAPEVAMALEDETAPPAPEVAKDNAVVVLVDPASHEQDTSHFWADLAVDQAADKEIEVIESDIEVSVCVPGAAHVCGAPVPDAIIAAERAPLLEHAKQRKATKKKRSKAKGSNKKGSLTPDKKKRAATKRAAAKNTKKWLASMKAANAAKAPGPNHAEEWQERNQQRACKAAPHIRLSGKQPAPPAKKAKLRKGREQLPEQVAVQAPQPPEQADPAPVGPGRVF